MSHQPARGLMPRKCSAGHTIRQDQYPGADRRRRTGRPLAVAHAGGPRDLPAVRVALALALGLLICSPLQAASYDAMLFPLLAVMPATRLDWIVVTRAAVMTAASEPFMTNSAPRWLTVIEKISVAGSPTLSIAGIVLVLLWFCVTRAWNPVASQTGRQIERDRCRTSNVQ